MLITVLMFFLGILASSCFSHLPTLTTLFSLSLVVLACFVSQKKIIRVFATTLLGLVWALFYAHFLLRGAVPHSLENKPMIAEGVVSSIPACMNNRQVFIFSMIRINRERFTVKAKLTWQNGRALRVGEKWRFLIKLKQPHGLRNLGSFDVEKSYFQQGIRAIGMVVSSPVNRCLKSGSTHCVIDQCRSWLISRIPGKMRNSEFYGFFLALSLGISSKITSSQWDILKITGTNHLVAISGLHIGLVASLFSKLFSYAWVRLPNAALRIPVIYARSIVGLMFAGLYSLLAGFSPSTQRAFLMIAIASVANLTCRTLPTFRALMLALGAICLINPYSFLSNGFWLSFIAVGVLVYSMQARLGQMDLWSRYGKPQWSVCIGMLPTVILFFQQVSFISLPANVIAIPWVSFLVVPFCLISLVLLPLSSSVAGAMLQVASFFFHIIWWALEKFSGLSSLVLSFSFSSQYQAVLAHIAAAISLLPRGLVSGVQVVVWWLASVFPHPTPLMANQLQLVVFDVGQGLATLIHTRHHTLIYDTGAKYSSFDMGTGVILPYLRRTNVKKIDVLAISHGDNDHIGGANSILKALPVSQIITSVPERFKQGKILCCSKAGAWNWDGVMFQFLTIPEELKLKGNNKSCVLKITQGKNSLLLTGDIEKKAELSLLKKYCHDLKADILLVPHHGSKTSSSTEFLNAVSPKVAVFSYGYLNSYGHPHSITLDRYRKRGVQLLHTVESGAITMTLRSDSDKVAVEEYRKKYLKIWHQNLGYVVN